MPTADLGHTHIHYQLSGSADGPVIVLAHALGADMSMWQPQLAALEPHFRVLRYDMRGHGSSSAPSGDYRIEQIANDLLSLSDALSIPQAIFCGISMSGLVGIWLGIHAPQRFSKLVLSATAAKLGNADLWNGRIAQANNEGMEPIAEATMQRWFTPAFREAHPEIVDTTRAVFRNTAPAGYPGCCAAIRDTDLRNQADTITLPTLFIAGEQDSSVPIADMQSLNQSIAASQLITLPGAHLVSVESAEAFNTALLGFLQNGNA